VFFTVCGSYVTGKRVRKRRNGQHGGRFRERWDLKRKKSSGVLQAGETEKMPSISRKGTRERLGGHAGKNAKTEKNSGRGGGKDDAQQEGNVTEGRGMTSKEHIALRTSQKTA